MTMPRVAEIAIAAAALLAMTVRCEGAEFPAIPAPDEPHVFALLVFVPPTARNPHGPRCWMTEIYRNERDQPMYTRGSCIAYSERVIGEALGLNQRIHATCARRTPEHADRPPLYIACR